MKKIMLIGMILSSMTLLQAHMIVAIGQDQSSEALITQFHIDTVKQIRNAIGNGISSVYNATSASQGMKSFPFIGSQPSAAYTTSMFKRDSGKTVLYALLGLGIFYSASRLHKFFDARIKSDHPFFIRMVPPLFWALKKVGEFGVAVALLHQGVCTLSFAGGVIDRQFE